MSQADYLLFMTQDALPEDRYLIETLVEAIEQDKKIGAAYARQLPREDCRLMEQYTRQFNYPEKSRAKWLADLPELGIKTYFCSNVCAMYKRELYLQLGGFVKKTILNNWSRAVLLNFLDTDLYERQGKAISNFEYALPEPQSDLAQEITKDPYNFDFVAIREDYSEKELKDALMDNITKFLMELVKGFAFVGREYTIPIEGTEEKIDLLFYHLYLHCYVVVEVKIAAFTSRDIGQIGTYVNIVDDLVNTDFDAKTVGLIICKSKNNILAKYVVNSSKEPIGISEYKLSNLLPVEYRASMPTIEEIENEHR